MRMVIDEHSQNNTFFCLGLNAKSKIFRILRYFSRVGRGPTGISGPGQLFTFGLNIPLSLLSFS